MYKSKASLCRWANICVLLLTAVLYSQSGLAKSTEIGAQIWIEPGYNQQQITDLVRLASESKLKTLRAWAMWSHLEPQPGVWTFDVYDWLFQACEKYDIKLQITLTSMQPPPFYGGEFWWQVHPPAVPLEHLDDAKAAEYIKRLVERYKSSPALQNWWLINEPYTPDNVTDKKRTGFRKDMEAKYKSIAALNKRWGTAFSSFNEVSPPGGSAGWSFPMPYYDWQYYCLKYYTAYMRWIRDEISKHDTQHGFHSNPAGVLQSFHAQETTVWRTFLTSVGTTIHPSWQFRMLKREQYAMGVGAICEILKNEAYPHPFWISELQGGNNTFSGVVPMCPSYSDIAQWTWTGVGQGAEKIIYWCLNPRPYGNEAGEWALLNFLNQPSERLNAAADIANCLKKENSFFDNAKPLDSKIFILISPESRFTGQRKGNSGYEGLDADAHIKSALSCYQALADKGLAANIKQLQDFQWTNQTGVVAIMPHIITLRLEYYDAIKVFLKGGNKLIVLGSTGYYDENEICMFQKPFPLKAEFGAALADLILYADHFQIPAMNGKYNLEVRSWMGAIENYSAEPISKFGQYITGVRNRTGNSEVVWIPSNVELGGWMYGNSALSAFLCDKVKAFAGNQPFQFKNKSDNINIHTMTDGSRYLTVINNGKSETNRVQLLNKVGKAARVVFCSDKGRGKFNASKTLALSPRECLVLMWE